ncbi:hypothetical protein MPRS_18160 [Mycobacterium paraseoulense]|nr:hypothetical protein MPRS_18160 [Mycobacterium paraseoulense]
MADDDSALHEKPLEFLASIANTGGDCDGQAILPETGTSGPRVRAATGASKSRRPKKASD